MCGFTTRWAPKIWVVAALILLTALGASSTGATTEQCRAENASQATTCAEEDNINIPLYDPAVKTFRITATHPTYKVNDYTCAADFSGCNGASAASAAPDVCTELHNDGINVLNVCTVTDWWRGQKMTVTSGQNSLSGHYIQWHRKIVDAPSWPQVLVLYQDGNLRLKPQEELGAGDPCFSSSVIVGPANPAKRPYIDIQELTIDLAAFALDITYVNAGTAHVDIAADRSAATATVSVGYDTLVHPAATFRSMWVADGNSDVDHVEAAAGTFPILGSWETLAGPEWFFHRQVASTHNASAPDIRVEMLEGNPKPVGGIAELPDVAAAPSTGLESSGGHTGAIAAAAIAGVITLGGAAWFARKRWAA